MSVGSGLGAVDAEAVAAAVLACPSVERLVGGGPGEQIATFLPGRRVLGVRVTEHEVEVHLASAWGVPIPEVAAEVRAAVAPLVAGLPVAVAVDDIEDPSAPAPPAAPVPPPPPAPVPPPPRAAAGGSEAVAVPAPS